MVNSVFRRSEQLENQIQTIRLKIPEWKVLFAIDGVMDPEAMADFLGIPEKDVLEALKKFKDMELISKVEDQDAEVDTESIPEAEDVTLEIPEPELGEDIEMEDLEKEEETEEEEVVEGRIELPAEEAAEEETTQTIEDETSEEFPETEQKEKEELADQEFDDFIGGLLNEEEEKEREGLALEEEPPLETEMPPEVDEFEEESTLETEMPPEGEEVKESLDTEMSPEVEETEDSLEIEMPPEVEDVEKEEEEDLGLGDFFKEDVAEAVVEAEEEEKETEVFDEEKLHEEIEPEAPETEVLPGKKKTILVVDDSVVIRKMVEIALENEEFDIMSVANGKDALKYLDDNNPDIIILDIMLPDVNGLDVLKAVKASKQIPVVMLSAKDTPRETSRAKELGADDFIPKPFKDEELVSKIKELVGD